MMRFAKMISFFLGPSFTLFPVPYVLVAKFTDNTIYALKWAIFSYVFIAVAAFFVLLGVLLGFFTNFDVSKREERPLLFSLLGLVIFFYLLSLLFLGAPKILFFGAFSLIGSLLIIVMVNKRIKASIHIAVLTGVVILISLAYGGYFFWLFLLVPFLAWARVKTKEHTIQEVAAGGLLGTIVTFFVYFIGRYFFFKV